MTFRTQVLADLSTFLNADEFADTLEIDGVSVGACVVEGNGETPATDGGVENEDTLLYVRASSFELTPVVNQRITVGDKAAHVVGVNEEQGILELHLRWFDS